MRLFNYQNFQFIPSCITTRIIHPDMRPDLSAQTVWPGLKLARLVDGKFPFSKTEYGEPIGGSLHEKTESNQLDQPPPISRRKSGQISLRSIKIQPDFNEIHRDLHRCSSSVLTQNKLPLTQTETNSTCGFHDRGRVSFSVTWI